MRFDMARLAESDLEAIGGTALKFHDVAPLVYGPLHDACTAERVRRQRLRLARGTPSCGRMEVVLHTRNVDELKHAVRCIAANRLAAERLGYRAAADFFKAALADLVDVAAQVVEARGQEVH